jgi:hypothetical protein
MTIQSGYARNSSLYLLEEWLAKPLPSFQSFLPRRKSTPPMAQSFLPTPESGVNIRACPSRASLSTLLHSSPPRTKLRTEVAPSTTCRSVERVGAQRYMSPTRHAGYPCVWNCSDDHIAACPFRGCIVLNGHSKDGTGTLCTMHRQAFPSCSRQLWIARLLRCAMSC